MHTEWINDPKTYLVTEAEFKRAHAGSVRAIKRAIVELRRASVLDARAERALAMLEDSAAEMSRI